MSCGARQTSGSRPGIEGGVADESEDEDVHYDLGLALTRQGKLDEAIQQYEEASAHLSRLR